MYSAEAIVATGSDLPIINVTGSANIHIHLMSFTVGSNTTPADNVATFMVERTTDVGTGGTSLTEGQLDPDISSNTGAAVAGTFSAAPTDSDELHGFAVNQRQLFEHFYDQRYHPMSTAAANNGLMLNSESSSSTQNANTTLFWEE